MSKSFYRQSALALVLFGALGLGGCVMNTGGTEEEAPAASEEPVASTEQPICLLCWLLSTPTGGDDDHPEDEDVGDEGQGECNLDHCVCTENYTGSGCVARPPKWIEGNL